MVHFFKKISQGRFQNLGLFLLAFTGLSAQAQEISSVKVDKIYVQCAVSQGNGFNWASTLSWLSAVIQQTGFKAYEYEMSHPGKRAGVDLSCYTGASSSGFVTALFDYLLSNPKLMGNQGRTLERKILTPQQTFDVANALYFLSLSTDFHSETLGLFADGLLSRLVERDKKSHRIDYDFWKADGSVGSVFPVFLQWVHAAYFYEPHWIQGPLPQNRFKDSALQEPRMRSLLQQYRIDDLISYPSVGSRSEIASLKAQKGKDLERLMKSLMFEARERLHGKMRGKALRDVKSLANDFCVTSFVSVLDRPLKPTFDYSQFKLVYICSHETVRKLRQSKVFIDDLNRSVQMKGKILLASVQNWEHALNITAREPGILSELSGMPTQAPINLAQVFEFYQGAFRPLAQQHPWLIMGGFPEARQQGWAARALLNDRLQELKKQGYEVEGRLALFARTEERKNPQGNFAQKTMVQYFTDKSHSQVSLILNEFYRWQDEFCSNLSKFAAPVAVDFYRMDWNLSGKPAALLDRSYILTAKGRNLVQIQTDYQKHNKLTPIFTQALSYDPMDAETFIPSQVGPSCR